MTESVTDERPTGRELRLVNAAVDVLHFLHLEWAPAEIRLTALSLDKLLGELYEAVALYKRHMLKPNETRPTHIPVRLIEEAAATRRQRLDELLARLAAASEGSRELDGAIYLALSGWTTAEVVIQTFPGSEYPNRVSILRRTVDNHVTIHAAFADYTTNLYTAARLVPEGWHFQRLERNGDCFTVEIERDDRMESCYGHHPDQHLAFVIGALRAQAATP